MDPAQEQAFQTCMQQCGRLLSLLENEKDSIRSCFHGEPLAAYLDATEEAISQVKKIRSTLQNLQDRQL